jgi:RsmE family RNA methyltransferase
MNLILFDEQLDAYRLLPGDPNRQHIEGVLRMSPGDSLYVGAVNGPRALAKITAEAEAGDGAWVLKPQWEPQVVQPLPLTLLCGLPRPQTARRVLFSAACLGAARLIFFAAEKAEPSYRSSKLWQTQQWRRHLKEGAEQAFHTSLPELAHADSLQHALALLAAQRTCLEHAAAIRCIALDVYEGTSGLSQALGAPGGVTLAVGAERGWSAGERDQLREHGFELAHLGQRVLRVETALVAASALASSALGHY